MRLPRPRGPLSAAVLTALSEGVAPVATPSCADADVLTDGDQQLALWVLYELSYRGFDGVDPDREWDTDLIGVRRAIEARFEAALRRATAPVLAGLDADADVADLLLALPAAADGPSPAAHLHRHADVAVLRDFLRERSVQQLKESDPQAFVLPRLSGAAKAALAELQYDEFGGGRPERLHQRLYAEALEAAGLDPAYGAHIDEVSAVSLAGANVMSLFALNRRLRGAAMGHLAFFEASSPVGSRKIAAGIERLGLPAAVSAYFHEHVEADSVHEHVAAHDICGALVAAEPDLRDDVLLGAAACLHLDELSAYELVERWTREPARPASTREPAAVARVERVAS
ncbi:iron-containing redox enzyme family protein [Nocardioides korecus]